MDNRRRNYDTLKAECLSNGILFEDHEFPANGTSIYYSKNTPRLLWKRPHELTKTPQFVVREVSLDLDQGELGNCWVIAAAAALATKSELFRRVVPEQNFGKDYAGIFRFYIWQYGTWREVVVDDRLPTQDGQLAFCRNISEPNEFWSALLEKAYAKLHGSYEALEAGLIQDAFVDMTGGIGLSFDLNSKRNSPRDLFNTLLYKDKTHALLGCSIEISKGAAEIEETLPNGLVIGHAYGITKLLRIPVGGEDVEMIRLKNPWGSGEWNGPWSDGSKEWNSLDPNTKKKIGLIFEDDGEFWMDFDSWLDNFHTCELCLLPEGVKPIPGRKHWIENVHHGSWVKGVCAGGCGNKPFQDMHWVNPQYSILLSEVDYIQGKPASDGKCTLVVSLMQKYTRLKKTQLKVQSADLNISFGLYKFTGDQAHHPTGQLSLEHFHSSVIKLYTQREAYRKSREVSHSFRVEPGAYVIIPSAFHPNEEADFLLRTYTLAATKTREIDTVTRPIAQPIKKTSVIKELFKTWAGSDGVLDHRELAGFLNEAYSSEISHERHKFNKEAARSLLIMMDHNRSGVLEFDEVEDMCRELNIWKKAFYDQDINNSGFIEIGELRGLMTTVGYQASRKVLTAISRKYGGKQGRLAFNDVVMVLCKTQALFDYFSQRSNGGAEGTMNLDLDDFVEVAMYC